MDIGYERRDSVLMSMGYPNYESYLNSDLWKGIRASVMLRDGGKCRLCGKPAHIVHHADYSLDSLEGISTALLFSLCNSCHRKLEFDMTDPERKLCFATVVKKTKAWLKARSKGKKSRGNPSIGLKYKARRTRRGKH